jgi:hypothetical protein
MTMEETTIMATKPQYITLECKTNNDRINFQNSSLFTNLYERMNKDLAADPNNNYEILEQTIIEAKRKYLPTKTVRFNKYKHKKCEWITTGILISIKHKDKLYKKLKQIDPNTDTYNSAKTNYKAYGKLLKTNIKIAKKMYYNKCLQKSKGNIKETWKTINILIGRNKKNRDLPEYFNIEGIKLKDSHIIAREFNKFFVNIGPLTAQKISQPPNKHYTHFLKKQINSKLNFLQTDQTEVERIINELQPKTSSGHDNISSKLLKSIKIPLVQSITLIMNQCINTGIFPSNLKLAKVIPIYKKNNRTILNNYRPISLLPVISKIFEKILHNQIYKYFKSNNLFTENQYGFLEGLSTELATMELTNRLYKYMDDNKIPISVFIDLSKAFDTIDHHILIHKLKYYGLEGASLRLITNYLTERTQYVAYDDCNSSILPIKCGVPQGSILGPLLFIIYTNDIVQVNTKFKIIMYADDTTLYTTLDDFGGNIQEINRNINLSLTNIVDWFKLNKLSLNISKTKYMLFHSTQRNIPNLNIELNMNVLEKLEHFNFLGLEIDSHLNWNTQVKKISGKVLNLIGILSRFKYLLPQHTLQMIYTTLIVPHFNYCLLIWGCNMQKIIKLQKKAIRIISLNHFAAHTEPIFKRLNLLKLQDIYKLRIYKFYYRLEHSKCPQYFTNFLQPANRQHQYNTRMRNNNNLVNIYIKHEFAKKSIQYNLLREMNAAPISFKAKIHTHSATGFAKYIKLFIIKNYTVICTETSCYSCRNASSQPWILN